MVNSQVGIGDSDPDYGLEIMASSSDGYFAVSGGAGVEADKFLIDENGYVGIGTAAPDEMITVSAAINPAIHIDSGSDAFLLIDSGATNRAAVTRYEIAGDTKWATGICDSDGVGDGTQFFIGEEFNCSADVHLLIDDSGNVGIGDTSPGDKLTITESGGLAIGDFNDNLIDDMEDTVEYWTASDTTNAATSTETSIVKVGSQSLQIAASGTSEDDTVKKSYGSSEDWSAFERLGFWIYADGIATSTVTTTQIISVQLTDSTNGPLTHKITIQEEDKWQYEEWNLAANTTEAYDGVDSIQFIVDVNNLGTINFYIDHLRLYDDSERTSEMFVDMDGTAVFMGRGGVEIMGPQTGSGQLPSIKIDSAVVEINQPLSVNVGGDVSFDYDLVFLNTGMAQITSEGPLKIAGGDPNHAENLTLTTQGTGDVVIELARASQQFRVTHSWAASTTIPFILNVETNVTTSPSAIFQIISDVNADENVVFDVDGGGNVRYDGTASTGASDVAENYVVEDETIASGDVVCLSQQGSLMVEKCSLTYQSSVVGVVAGRPALLMGGNLESSMPVALTGRVPVKTSLENGEIKVGDALTSASSTPGTAMKATRAGRIIGYALEVFDYDKAETLNDSTIDSRILVFVNVGWQGNDLSVLFNSDGQIMESSPIQSSLASLGLIVNEYGALTLDKLKAGGIEVGSSEQPTGITIYDEETGQAYCIKMKAGQMVSILGVCPSYNYGSQPLSQSQTFTYQGTIFSGAVEVPVYNDVILSSSQISTNLDSLISGWQISIIGPGFFIVTLSQTATQEVIFEYQVINESGQTTTETTTPTTESISTSTDQTTTSTTTEPIITSEPTSTTTSTESTSTTTEPIIITEPTPTSTTTATTTP